MRNLFNFQAAGFGYGVATSNLWGFVVPHTMASPGAVSFDGRYSENQYARIMIGKTINSLPMATLEHDSHAAAAKFLLKFHGVNSIVEPHFNAYNRRAKGYEILVLKGDEESRRHAEFFLEDFEERYPNRRNRGIKLIEKNGRGYRNLQGLKRGGANVAMLSELFFGDNKEDFLTPHEQAVFWRRNLMEDFL